MNQNNRFKNLFPNILLGIALIGFIILWLSIGGRNSYQPKSRDIYSLYPIAIGIGLIIPYFIYLFSFKSKSRNKLKPNKKDSNKTGINNTRNLQSKKRKKRFEIFVLNESNDNLIVNRNSELDNNQWYIFQMKPNESIFFSNGIIFDIDKNNNLEIEDFRNQIIGLGDDYFKKYDVPDYVDWAFIIAEQNKGDTAE